MAKFLVALLCCAVTILQINALAVNKRDAKCAEPTCTTPECIHSASAILQNLKPSVDPCDSFYEFACGSFPTKHVIPDDQSMITGYSLIIDDVLRQMNHVLEEPVKDGEAHPFVLAKNLYKLCYDTKAIDAEGTQPLEAILSRLGGWPVLEGSKWKEADFNWKSTLYSIQEEGFNVYSLIPVIVSQSSLDSSQNLIKILQGLSEVDRASCLGGFENELVAAYYNYIVELAVLLGGNRDTALRELKEVVELEIEIVKMTIPEGEQRNASLSINQMTIRELQNRFNDIPWIEFINNVFKSAGIIVNMDDIVDVANPTYLSNLIALLNRTPERVLHNHLLLHVVLDSVPYLSKKFKRASSRYQEATKGTKVMVPRWTDCVKTVNYQMNVAASSLYVRKYFDLASKENVEQLVQDLRDAFVDDLKGMEWMDEETKAKALEKELAITPYVGYPQELLDDKIIEEYYATLNFSSSNYLEAILRASSFLQNKGYSKLRKPIDKKDWTNAANAITVNANYDPQHNAIYILAAILQGVFFNNERPHYMNYGSMGFVIGHEITHGFDDQGSQYDKNGEVSDWWGEETKKKFVEKAQCFIDQFGNFTLPEINMNVNGLTTQGENMADSGGIRKAYEAYEKWIERNGEEPGLPGLNYTPRQLFWISTANVWCIKQRKESLRDAILTDTHSPAEFRVDGTFQNTEYFAHDFNCPAGSRMNPVKKCEIW